MVNSSEKQKNVNVYNLIADHVAFKGMITGLEETIGSAVKLHRKKTLTNSKTNGSNMNLTLKRSEQKMRQSKNALATTTMPGINAHGNSTL